MALSFLRGDCLRKALARGTMQVVVVFGYPAACFLETDWLGPSSVGPKYVVLATTPVAPAFSRKGPQEPISSIEAKRPTSPSDEREADRPGNVPQQSA